MTDITTIEEFCEECNGTGITERNIKSNEDNPCERDVECYCDRV